MVSQPAEVLNPDGQLVPSELWFPPSTQLSSDPFFVVAITGPQASGKSTMVNALFDTSFPVASKSSIGNATTRGILASHLDTQRGPTLILDVEGADARARGRDAKLFAAQCTSFVTAVADVVIVNIWFHDACRLDSAAHSLLRSIFFTAANTISDNPPTQTALVIVVRDADEDSEEANQSLISMIRNDIDDIWADVVLECGLPVGQGASPLNQVVDLHVFMFPHIRHQSDLFSKRVQSLKAALATGNLVKPQYSKQIPADSFSTYAHTLWDSVATTITDQIGQSTSGAFDRKVDDFYTGDDFAIVSAYRCDEVFSQVLADASGEISDLLDTVESGSKIENLGKKCDDIIERSLQEYDAETSDFAAEPVYERKRTELEAIIDTGLMSVFMKNIAIMSREALASFKASIAEDLPADYALYNVMTTFSKRAKESIRRGGSWTFESEQVDLKNMMQEISEQQRKLLESQVNASQQQSKAIQFLRMQHAQMQAVQQQALGGSVGQWNVGAAYRPPDSNVNVSLAYQQGRTNVQVSMVPDESATLLGPTGFTAGLGPGNLGMSFNVNF